jgi:hypothetical protein
MTDLKLGEYKHFKGKQYEVNGIARDTENLKELVIYKTLYNSEEFVDKAL